ncbi:MAG: hypothetical protein ACRDH9_13425 [Actinomycetota bacterium]
MKPVRPLIALTLAVLVAAPASATHGGIHPKFKSQGVYFHCTGDTPVYQVNWAAAGGASSSFASWDTSPPPGSVTDGNGCMGLDAGGASNEFGDPVFEGTFTGNLRDMTVRIYDFILPNTRQGASAQLKVYAEIDGDPLFPRGPTANIYEGRNVTVTPSRGNSGLTDEYEFTITNIGFANDIKDASGNVIGVETGGAALEDGNGTMEHTIKLLVGLATGIGADPPTGIDFFVWDTTEVPSGITFNPASPAPATVAADLPDFV